MKIVVVDGQNVVAVEELDRIFAGGFIISHDARLKLIRFAENVGAIQGGKHTPDARIYYIAPGMSAPSYISSRELVRQLANPNRAVAA